MENKNKEKLPILKNFLNRFFDKDDKNKIVSLPLGEEDKDDKNKEMLIDTIYDDKLVCYNKEGLSGDMICVKSNNKEFNEGLRNEASQMPIIIPVAIALVTSGVIAENEYRSRSKR